MNEPMPYGQVVQELTHLRAQYEQFIIDRERERIIRLLQEPYWHNLRSPGIHEDCKMCETIWLINDINIL